MTKLTHSVARMKRVANPVILLVGKTGAGKSTLGNLLLKQPHDSGTFKVSADMESVTKECEADTLTINGVEYDIVDTPGIFDTQRITEEILKEIANAVHKCAHGVKAILFVFEARRFTEEQKNVLNGVRMFLGKDATNYIIAVFSHATKKQIGDRDIMKEAWNDPIRSFIRDIENRWGISPDSDYFPPDDSIHQKRLNEIRTYISSIRGVYTTEQLERTRREQAEIKRKKEEEEKKAKQEYEKKLKEAAKKEADEAHKREIEKIKKEQEVQREYEENLRKKEKQEADEQHRQAIERLKQEQKEQQEREENLRKQEREAAEEEYNRKLAEAEQKRMEQEKQEQTRLIEELQRRMEESERRHQEELERYKNEIADLRNRKPTDCFSLDTKVQLASGKFIEMSELKVGDRIASNVINGELEYSEVYLISHLGHYDFYLEMIKIEFTNPDGKKGHIRTTTTHCIFREDLSIIYAKDVVPGKTKILVLNKTNELIPVTVEDLIIEEDTGYISFYTRSGTVIANNTLCSCYDDCPTSQALMDLAFTPIRWWTKVFPSTHRQKELHPYAQTLETAYLTWCNALNFGKQILGLP